MDLIGSPTTTSAPVGLNSPQKKPEPIKRPAVTSSPSKENGSSPPKKRITINREPLPPAAVDTETTDVSSKDDDESKKVVKITAALTAEEKAKLRAEKFGISAEVTAAATSTTAPKKNASSLETVKANPFLDERMKKRAERFNNGTSAATATTEVVVSLTTVEDVKLAKRKERFGLTAVDESAKKETRAARFAGASTEKASSAEAAPAPTTAAADDKKQLRAARFGGGT